MTVSNYPTSYDEFGVAKTQISPRERARAYTKIVDGVKAIQNALGLNLDKKPIVTKTANYTVTLNDGTILVDSTSGNLVITLPSATSASGYCFNIKKIVAGNTVTVTRAGSNTIDGATTVVLSTNYSSTRIQSNGTHWFVLAGSGAAGATGATGPTGATGATGPTGA